MTVLAAWALEHAGRGLALAIASAIVYLIARRAGPRAGATAASWGIVALTALPVLLLVPLPSVPLPIDLGDGPATPKPEAVGASRGPEATAIEGADLGNPLDAIDGLVLDDPGPVTPARPEVDSASPATIETDAPRRTVWESLREPATTGLTIAILGSIGLGALRLAIGLNAVRRLRRGSQGIDDRTCLDQLGRLREELSCPVAVEVRESSGVTTPATLGWRRPLILLPIDWREWDPAELRSVLAHELAHVARGDYRSGLIAQVGVALHAYDPLVYWLAARLRLDQELGADAVAATATGGRQPYLTCLARLALRRDDRGVGWPARAFLPGKGTFLRRIEMLRHSRPINDHPPGRLLRLGTAVTLALAAVLCAGLRGPRSSGAASAQEAQEPSAPPRVSAPGFDLAAVPVEAAFVAAVKPADLASMEGQGPILDLIGQLPPLRDADLALESIEQLTFATLRRDDGVQRPVYEVDLVFVKSIEPFDAGVVGDILGEIEESTYLGKSYTQSRSGPLSVYEADDRTLAICMGVSTLRTLISGLSRPPGRQVWADAVAEVDDGLAVVAFETPWIASRMEGDFGNNLILGLGRPVFDRAYAYAMGLTLDEKLKFDAVALCGDTEGADRVAETIEAVMTLVRNGLQNTQADIDRAPPEAADAIRATYGLFDNLLSGAEVEVDETLVRMHTEADADLAQITQITLPPVRTARTTARRAQSMNNLKQIGLGLFNYVDASENSAFPPPVLYSDNGTPYSWRVAILPYIEQQPLYEAYHFDEPWDSPANRIVLENMPATYNEPASDNDPTHADYFAFVGPTTLLGMPGEPTMISRIRDGTSNTIAVVGVERAIPWTKPEDIPIDPDFQAPLPELRGPYPDLFIALFADGSVRSIKKSIDPNTLKSLITRAGGEVITMEVMSGNSIP